MFIHANAVSHHGYGKNFNAGEETGVSNGLTGMFFSAVKTWRFNILLQQKVSIKVINDCERRHKSRKLLIDNVP